MKTEKWLVKQGVLLTLVAVFLSIFSFAKETIFAAYFGTSEAADAYTVAIQIPEIIFSFVWEAIHAIVVPLYTEQIEKYGKNAGHKFILNIIGLIFVFSTIVIFICLCFSSYIIKVFSPGLNQTTNELASSLLRWTVPMMMFEGIIRICHAILNVQKEFLAPKIFQSIRNIVSICVIVLFAKRFGIYAAAIGILTGMAIECFITCIRTSKYEKPSIGFSFHDAAIEKAKRMAIPIIISVGAMDINQIIDKMIASYLEPGSIVALSYASKLSSIIRTLLVTNIITVVYPSFSEFSAKGEYENLKSIFIRTLEYVVILCVPLIVGGCTLQNEIIGLVFERGAFDSKSTEFVSPIFACYLSGIVFVAIRNVAIRLYTASYDTRTVTVNSIIGVIINIILNLLLAHVMGAVGLALATAVSMAIVCVSLLCLINKKIFCINYSEVLITAGKTCVSSLVMGVFLLITKQIVNTSSLVFWEHLLFIATAVLSGGIVYLVVQILLKTNHIRDLCKMAINRIMRGKN